VRIKKRQGDIAKNDSAENLKESEIPQRLKRLLKKSEKQIPHRLKSVRNDKNKGLIRRT
jgi:hypothetical protein